jgi:hypothetical protein
MDLLLYTLLYAVYTLDMVASLSQCKEMVGIGCGYNFIYNNIFISPFVSFPTVNGIIFLFHCLVRNTSLFLSCSRNSISIKDKYPIGRGFFVACVSNPASI